MSRSACRRSQLCDRSHSYAEGGVPGMQPDRQAARTGGWREAVAIGAVPVDPRKLADTVGTRSRRARARSMRDALARSARRWFRRRRTTPTDIAAVITTSNVNVIRVIPVTPIQMRRRLASTPFSFLLRAACPIAPAVKDAPGEPPAERTISPSCGIRHTFWAMALSHAT